jgi:hypothetical protein
MNGIPTTFNEGLPSYAVVGGREKNASSGVSAVILAVDSAREGANGSETGDFRRELYKSLGNCGFDFVLSLETGAYRQNSCDFDALSAEFPFVRFILLQNTPNLGLQINLVTAEIREKAFFVLRRGFSPVFLSTKSLASDGEPPLCSAPLVLVEGKGELSSAAQPFLSKRGGLNIELKPHRSGGKTLFPFAGMGLYNRERFVRLGGFDGTISDEYWQLMDFGLRSYLWGEQILCSDRLKVVSKSDFPPASVIIDESYRRFHLKNLSPVFRLDAAHLQLKLFPRFLAKSGLSPSFAWEEFSQARAWVSKNAYRWKRDAHSVVEEWGFGGRGTGFRVSGF